MAWYSVAFGFIFSPNFFRDRGGSCQSEMAHNMPTFSKTSLWHCSPWPFQICNFTAIHMYIQYMCVWISSVHSRVQLPLRGIHLARSAYCFVTMGQRRKFLATTSSSTLSVLGEKFPIVALNWLYIDGTSWLALLFCRPAPPIPFPIPTRCHRVVCLNFQLISFHFIFAGSKKNGRQL